MRRERGCRRFGMRHPRRRSSARHTPQRHAARATATRHAATRHPKAAKAKSPRHNVKRHALSASSKAKMSAARKGKTHPHKGSHAKRAPPPPVGRSTSSPGREEAPAQGQPEVGVRESEALVVIEGQTEPAQGTCRVCRDAGEALGRSQGQETIEEVRSAC